jgi:hypothetical protein
MHVISAHAVLFLFELDFYLLLSITLLTPGWPLEAEPSV